MKLYIKWEYKLKKQSFPLISEMMDLQTALDLSMDIEKTGRVHHIKFFDEHNEEWKKKEIEKWLKSLETEPTNVNVYFDGGYQKDIKAAGIGIVIYYEKNKQNYRIRKNESLELLNSNNEAEYAALWVALNELENLGVHHMPIKIYGDSQVVINQITGEWPVYEDEFNKWIDKIESKLLLLGLKAEYHLINRQKNKEADQLATQALKEIKINSSQQIPPSFD
jgi:ribonuclease HI